MIYNIQIFDWLWTLWNISFRHSQFNIKHNLMHILLHLIWFHKIIISTNSRENQVFNLSLIKYIFSKISFKANNRKKKEAFRLRPGWEIVCVQAPSIIYLQNWWLMIKRNFVDIFIHNSEIKATLIHWSIFQIF